MQTNPDLIYEAQELMMQCEGNTALMAKIVFPHRFEYPFSFLHYEMFKALDKSSAQKVLIIAPRGLGKTTVVVLGYAAKEILFKRRQVIAYVTNSGMNAVIQTEKLKSELLNNRMIGKIWGNLKGDWFTKDVWQTSTGITILPRGSGQQIRGVSLDVRPDLIIIDDLEDPEGVMSETQREKVKTYMMDDVMNSVDFKTGNWRIVMIGSMLHEDSYIANIKAQYDADIEAGRKPDWEVVDLSICDDEYKSNWPEAFSDEFIQQKRLEYAKNGKLDHFAMEFMSVCASPDDNFQKSFFQRYRESELPDEVRNRLVNIVLLDPARTTKKTSCDSAVVVWGVDPVANRYYIRDIRRDKFHPKEVINYSLAACQRWKNMNGAALLGVEITGLNEWITFPFYNEMARTGRPVRLLELKARGKKEERSAAMLPFYEYKQVFHEESIADFIELPLLSWPRCKFWDVIDAASYLPMALEMGKLYFLPQVGTYSTRVDEEVYNELKRRDAAMGPIRRQNVA